MFSFLQLLPTQTSAKITSSGVWNDFWRPERVDVGDGGCGVAPLNVMHPSAFFSMTQQEKNAQPSGEESLIIPTCARLQWEGQDEAISCLSTDNIKSLYTSVSYFLFWHNKSSKLSRHDRTWQVPRTLAKLNKEEAVRCREGDELASAPCLLSPLLLETSALPGEVQLWWKQFTKCPLKSDRVEESCREKVLDQTV